jgi:hypothetical protein
LIARPTHRLIRGRFGLPRTCSVWRSRFPWRRLLHHWPRRRGIGRAQGLHLAPG